MLRSDSVKMSVSPRRGAHFQESGLQKDLPEAMKPQSKSNHFFDTGKYRKPVRLRLHLEVKMHQEASKKPSEKQA